MRCGSASPIFNHSTLAVALNLKRLNPREVIAKAVDAYASGAAPIASVEGFVRQILGWREYARGIYFTGGDDYTCRNAPAATAPRPTD